MTETLKSSGLKKLAKIDFFFASKQMKFQIFWHYNLLFPGVVGSFVMKFLESDRSQVETTLSCYYLFVCGSTQNVLKKAIVPAPKCLPMSFFVSL